MSHNSDAFVGASGMKPRKRGLSAEITVGAMIDVYPQHLIGLPPLFRDDPGEEISQFLCRPRAPIDRNWFEPQPVLHEGKSSTDHAVGSFVDCVHRAIPSRHEIQRQSGLRVCD
jgi:hypothetical protein